MKVLGMGDCVVDIYDYSNTAYPGGNAYNFSVHAKKLGLSSSFFGIFGDDEMGSFLKDTLLKLGIEVDYCITKKGPSGFTNVTLVDGDRVFIGGNSGGVSRQDPLVFSPKDIEYINGFDLIHSSCFSGIEEELSKLNGCDSIISFDFSSNLESEYLTHICPYIDFALFSAGDLSDQELKNRMTEINNLGPSMVLATRGDEGALLYANSVFILGKTEKIIVKDTMGAGDAFVSAFLTDLLQSGWKKGGRLSEDQINLALDAADKYAAKICMVDGAFGHGKKIGKGVLL